MSDSKDGPFARWLRNTLRSRGMPYAEFARRLGTSRSSVSNWLNGQIPTYESCDRIAIVLDIPLGEVLTIAGHREIAEQDSLGETKAYLIDLITSIPSEDLDPYIPIFERLAGVKGRTE